MTQESIDLPRGVRFNNPGNIRISDIAWQGKLTPSPNGDYEAFDTPENGLRAMAKNLLSYARKYSINTALGIASRWAPPHENETNAYATLLAREAGLSSILTVYDLTNAEALISTIKGIVKAENGTNLGLPWYSDETIRGVVLRVLAEP